MGKIIVSPSILNADFSNLQKECLSLQKSGADWIHCDVMDGAFVPNISFGLPVVEAVKRCVKIPLDVHLMVQTPEKFAEKFVDAGADIVTVHVEACENFAETANIIRRANAKVGIALSPKTPIETIIPYADLCDMILIMTVEPGFGGQRFIEECLEKIQTVRNLFPNKKIEVDGGINEQTAKLAVAAGADVLVAGSYVIKSQNRKDAIQKLKNL